MSLKLSVDILSIIFEDIEQENDKSLYSCIFVNREWCQIAIPFLWKNPWKKINDDMVNRYEILLKCFLMLMTKESKEFLKRNGINFLIEDSSFKIEEDSLSQKKPLFNYARFFKVIDSFKINNMIYHNIKNNSPNTSIQDYHEYLVEQEILKLLISNTSKLKCLILSNNSHPIGSFPNSFISLSKLNELHCYTSIDASVFHELSKLCRNIERLVIEGDNDNNNGLLLFIEQQINLKRVKIWKGESYIGFVAQRQCKRLGEALATKSSSIIELELGKYPITIPPVILKKFQKNLTIFKFTIDYELTEERLINEFENVLKDISLPNLQQLIIYGDYIPPLYIIAKMIEKTNGELKKINLGAYYFDEFDGDILVSAIAKHCPKLELLAIEVDNLNQLLELIKRCDRLRGLVLRSYYDRDDLVELFTLLCNYASNQLRKLQLDNSWKISKGALNDFFKNWKQQDRNSLDFYMSFDIFKDEYEDIIRKYQEMGVIRKFDKSTVYNLLDNWE